MTAMVVIPKLSRARRLIFCLSLFTVTTSAFHVPTSFGALRLRKGLSWSMCESQSLHPTAPSRRSFMNRLAFAVIVGPSIVTAETIEVDAAKKGSQRGVAIAPQDFAFFKGKNLPRVLDFEDLPKQEGNKAIYNAWGACIQDSCSYVPLKQRYDGYKKYKDSTARATSILQGPLYQCATGAATFDTEEGKVFEKALRRGVLFANILLISENYGTSNEALAARYYVNEAYFAMLQIQRESGQGNGAKAREWWDLCRDSWNSYLTLINRAIVPKVGEKFPRTTLTP